MSRGSSAFVTGLGTASPATRLSQRDIAAAALPCHAGNTRLQRVLPALYRRAGVTTRGAAPLDQPARRAAAPSMLDLFPAARNAHDRGPNLSERLARYDAAALPLARDAARAALAGAHRVADEIDALVTVTCTGLAAPGIDLALVEALPLRPDVSRTLVGFMGCHGAMNGLRVAHALSTANAQRVLLVCVEVCTVHFQYHPPDNGLVANALFADGAAACVIEPAAPASTNGHGTPPRVIAQASVVVPGTADAMTWRPAEHGFVMTLSPRVPGLVESALADAVTPWLAAHGLNVAQVGGWAVHPGGPRVIGAVERALSLPAGAGDVSRAVLAEHGNMSSPTVLFILERFAQQRVPRPWVTLAFGPGLTIEMALWG